MKPAEFRLLRPRTIEEALHLIALHGADAKIIAGGQSLVPLMNLRMATPEFLVDIGRLDELRFVDVSDECVRIGAATTQAAVLQHDGIAVSAPLLHRALKHVGHVQTRARGTLGGSLVHADPAAELCLVSALLDAHLVILGGTGRRKVAASDFFQGALVTDMQPDELLCEVDFTPAPPGTRVAFREIARRHGDFAIASIGIQFEPQEAGRWRLRCAAGGIEDRPRVFQPIYLSNDGRAHREAVSAAIEAELNSVDANSDIQASANYRITLSKALLSDCLDEVFA